MADSTSAPNYEFKIGSKVSKDDQELKTDFQSFVIERDMFQPDMAAIVMSNQGGQYAQTKIGDEIELSIGDNAGEPIYKGEVVGLEPIYRGGEKSKILIRAMNKFHRLLRHRKSVTFMDKTDEQILNQVVGDAGLSLEWKHEKSISYKHVYQHNQTDMEFLRTRAARMGCHVWCVDKKIFVKEPDLQQGPALTLSVSATGGDASTSTIKSFTHRLSSSSILK
jgi:phage protein D